MKKYIPLALGLFLTFSTPTWAQTPVTAEIVIHGQTLSSDQPALSIGGRTFLPLRPVFKALGASVKYENKQITAKKGSKTVVMSPGIKTAKINGETVPLDAPPQLVNGSTYVPLRFVAKALGDEVSFDSKTNVISVGEAGVAVEPDRIDMLKGRLKQLVVGNQGAILKVRNPEGDAEVYYRGLDDRNTAPYKAKDHQGILAAIDMGSDAAQWAEDTVYGFDSLPKKQAVAFLGLIYSAPAGSPYDAGPEVDKKIQDLLIRTVTGHKSVIIRRQAVLAMAVGDSEDSDVLETVLNLYESSENLWETFPVQQYFEYHAAGLKARPDFSSIRARAAAVNSLYTANILGYLDGN